MKKTGLRKLFHAKRDQLSVDEYKSLNKKIVSQVQLINLIDINCIHIFLPIIEKKEIDTFPLIVWLKDHHPDIRIAIPRADFGTSSLKNFLYSEHMLLEKNKYGILEPTEGEIINTKEIDLVFVPLLAFDQRGYRVGYGKGFYDRFLHECKPGVIKTGLSFFDPVEIIEDVDEYDIRLDQCITPEKIYHF